MTHGGAAEALPRVRLNPFAFPSETTFRFLLFMAGIVGFSVLGFDWVFTTLTNARAEAVALGECVRGLPVGGEVATNAQLEAFRACKAAVQEGRRLFILAGVAVLLAVAAVIYAMTIARRRRKFRQLARDDAPEIVAEVEGSAREMAVRPSPRLAWNPLDRRSLAVAFGGPRNRFLAVSGGLMTLFVRDRATFRAVVLHELAHLRNGDLDLAQFAIAVWHSLLIVALAPFAVVLVVTFLTNPASVVGIALRLLALAPLVYVILCGILRAREQYADVRASVHEPAIRGVLAARDDPPGRPWQRLMRWHPPPSDRVAVSDQPARRMSLGPLDAVLLGVVGSLAYEEVAMFVGYFGLDGFATRGLAAFAFAPLAGAAVAFAMWNHTYAAAARTIAPPRALTLGLSLAAGFLVGQRLSLLSVVSDDTALLRADFEVFYAAMVVLIAAGAVLLVRWLVAAARLWLPVATRRSSRAWAARAFTIAAAALVSAAIATLGVVVASRPMIEIVLATPSEQYHAVSRQVWVGPEAAWRILMSPEASIVFGEPLVLVFFMILAAFPLAAVAWYRGIPSHPVAPWTALPGPESAERTDAIVLVRPETRTAQTVAIAIAATLVVAVAIVVLHLWLRANMPAETRATVAFQGGLLFWLISVVILGQALAGAVTAAQAPELRVIHAALAGLLVGVGGFVAVGLARATTACVPALAVVESRACGQPPSELYLAAILVPVATVGIMAAIVAGVAVALVAEPLRNRTGQDRLRAPATGCD